MPGVWLILASGAHQTQARPHSPREKMRRVWLLWQNVRASGFGSKVTHLSLFAPLACFCLAIS